MLQSTSPVPQHIAIIMDGNGRWAQERGLPRAFGHRAGAERVKEIVEHCSDLGVKYITMYAFSWENWERPEEEIHQLMRLLDEFIRRETPDMLKKGIRLQSIGRIDHLPEDTVQHLKQSIKETAGGKKICLTLALSYGSRQEIVDAVRTVAGQVKSGELNPKDIDERSIQQALYTADYPDPDLLVRTSGELRLSNFLLWQLSYTEIYVTEKNWPDFDIVELEKAITEYQKRDRRYGKTKSTAKESERISLRS